jgi:hypothetical protein
VAKHQQHRSDDPAASAAGSPAETRAVIPAPANDNRGASSLRIVLATAALAIALCLGLLALQPFG